MTTEIEKLERRWHENPLGLTFAPLAEAYRKSGALARALELLDSGLAQHPGYVPAHIVRGRCHLDSGEKALAELDFLCVVELDPENVIALKALADLAEAEGRTSDAIRRLEALLDIDRNNEEAESQLMRLRANPAPLAVSEPLITQRNDAATLTPGARPLEGIEILDPEAHFPSISGADSAAPGPPEAPSVEKPSASLADLPSELTAWLEESVEVEAAEAVPIVVTPDPELEPEPEAEPATEPPAGEAEPDLMVTETMAEIFLRQGHRELALAVYTQLLQREPGNERIKSAAEQLAASLAPPAPPVAEPPPRPVRQYDAASTGGIPVQDFLATILSSGRPRPAAPVHPPAFEPTSEATGRPASREPSFDEFFASEESPAPAGAAPGPEAVPDDRGEPARAADPDELEQFHAWLRGLKS